MKFSLLKNKFYKNEGNARYVACTRVCKRITKEKIFQDLCYTSTLTEADAAAVLTGLEKILVQYLAMGCSIDLGFLSLGFNVMGKFDSPKEGFQKGRNWINVNAKVKKSFQMAVNNTAKPEKVHAKGIRPQPLSLTKISGNKAIKEPQPGDLIRISGANLSFKSEDNETGVYLKQKAGNVVRISEYTKAGKTCILLKLPADVKPGKHDVEVRTRTRSGKIIWGFLDSPVNLAA